MPKVPKRSRSPKDPRGGFQSAEDFSNMRTLDGHLAMAKGADKLTATELSETIDARRNVHQYGKDTTLKEASRFDEADNYDDSLPQQGRDALYDTL